jgi:hypothetical protein
MFLATLSDEGAGVESTKIRHFPLASCVTLKAARSRFLTDSRGTAMMLVQRIKSAAAMTIATFTDKITTLYVAYAPEFDVSAWGACRDEALNNLAAEIHQRRPHGVGKAATITQ